MLNNKSAYLLTWLIVSTFISTSYSQNSKDITKANAELEQIKKSGIKSKTIWEYHYLQGNENPEALRDSGYKSYYYGYDKDGRITDYTKYFVFSDLTVRETYRYGTSGNIVTAARYNSAGEMIEQIDFKYNKQNLIKREEHTAFFNSVRPGVYFSIQASIDDDPLFAKLQDDLEIEPHLSGYTITVNISDADEQNQYLVIGDESDPTSPRYSWSQLTVESQRGLLGFNGPQRKEHKYISKNVAKVTYKYDAKGNLGEKVVINTANDELEKETFKYDASNHKTGYYRYNENGKVTSMESYTYDEKGRLKENIGMEPDGKVASRVQYKYGDLSVPDEKSWVNRNGETNSVYRYKYDNDLRIVEEQKLRGEGEIESRSVYVYDEKGNLMQIVKYDSSDKKERLTKYIYEFY